MCEHNAILRLRRIWKHAGRPQHELNWFGKLEELPAIALLDKSRAKQNILMRERDRGRRYTDW